jgi:hypothetical protein
MRIALALVLVLTPAARAAEASEPLLASRTTIVFGGEVTLFGRFTNGFADQPVILREKEYGDTAYSTLAVLTTKRGGRWRMTVTPAILTSYLASTENERSAPLDIHVRPRVSLTRNRGRFVARVVSNATYEHRFILIQRRARRGWTRIARIVLSRKPRRFNVPLPLGVSRLRAYLPRSQAGAGYVAGFSPAIVVRR